jgi:hypothetical protein
MRQKCRLLEQARDEAVVSSSGKSGVSSASFCSNQNLRPSRARLSKHFFERAAQQMLYLTENILFCTVRLVLG